MVEQILRFNSICIKIWIIFVSIGVRRLKFRFELENIVLLKSFFISFMLYLYFGDV